MTSREPAVLIVEDQPFVGMVASDILRESGFATFHAYDASAAAGVLDAHPEIEVVVTEAALPGAVGGVELARRLAAERPDLKLVVTGAAHQLSHGDMPRGAHLLRKPFASEELRNVVSARARLLDA